MKINNTKIYGLENAIRCSKYPMTVDIEKTNVEITKTVKKLGHAKVGSGHDNFLKGIIVQFDLTFSNKAWVEMERYHFIDIISSQSTMHRITQFELRSQCNSYVDEKIIEIVQEKINLYNSLENKDTGFAKELYLEILYNIPSGLELTAGISTNYQQLKTIYYQRRNHRLPDWQNFCNWIEKLPEFKELIIGEVISN